MRADVRDRVSNLRILCNRIEGVAKFLGERQSVRDRAEFEKTIAWAIESRGANPADYTLPPIVTMIDEYDWTWFQECFFLEVHPDRIAALGIEVGRTADDAETLRMFSAACRAEIDGIFRYTNARQDARFERAWRLAAADQTANIGALQCEALEE